RRDDYNLRATTRSTLLTKVGIALTEAYKFGEGPNQGRLDQGGRGLALLALKMLQEADPQQLGEEERAGAAFWQVRLLLMLGRGRGVRRQAPARAGPRLRALPGPAGGGLRRLRPGRALAGEAGGGTAGREGPAAAAAAPGAGAVVRAHAARPAAGLPADHAAA